MILLLKCVLGESINQNESSNKILCVTELSRRKMISKMPENIASVKFSFSRKNFRICSTLIYEFKNKFEAGFLLILSPLFIYT